MLESKSDEDLMLSFQAGEAAAFEALLARHQKSVFNFIFRFVNNREEAEELLQEVFIKVYRNVKDYNPVGKFKTWLFTVARNLCVDHYRKKRLRYSESLDEVKEAGDLNKFEQIANGESAPDELSSAAELEKILTMALSSLNEDQKEVFLLREKMGFKFEEIAEMTNVSVNTVKSRMRYALEGIKKVIMQSHYRDLLAFSKDEI